MLRPDPGQQRRAAAPGAVGRVAGKFDKVFVTSSPYDRWQCPATDIGFFLDTLASIPGDRLYLLGAHPTERPRSLLELTGARAAVIGEPEQTVVALALGDTGGDALHGIDGIAFLAGGELHRTRPPAHPLDLDRLPAPAFHLLPMHRYHYEFMGGRFTILEGSRGCPSRCRFCYQGMYGSVYREKSVERLMRETLHVAGRFGVRNIYYMDLAFGMRKERLRRFCDRMILSAPGVDWCCQMRVADIDPGMFPDMRRAGCSLIHMGIESGSRRLRASMGKPVDLDHAAAIIREARRNRIRTVAFFNLGFPEETPEEMEETVRTAVRLDPTYAAFHWIIPYPGTRLAQDIGLDPEAFPPHRFQDHVEYAHALPGLKRKLKNAYLRFYLRPAVFRNILLSDPAQLPGQAALFMKNLLS